MLRAARFVLAMVSVGGCAQTRDVDLYRELTPGIGLSQVRQVLAVPRAKIWVDQAEGDMRAIMATTRSIEINVILERDRVRLVRATYHYLPHETPPGAPATECAKTLAPIRAELEELYGPPEVSTEDDQRGRTTALTWRLTRTAIRVTEYIDGDRCGILDTLQFDGNEADFQDFQDRTTKSHSKGQ